MAMLPYFDINYYLITSFVMSLEAGDSVGEED